MPRPRWRWRPRAAALLVAVLVRRAAAQVCANRCSGHGACLGGSQLLCACSEGWAGPDCSQRTCPRAPAWAVASRLTDDAHSRLAECAAAGVCDRGAGTCLCSPGFEGAACQLLSCGGGASAPCGLNGRCISLRQAAAGFDGFRLVSPPSNYDEWDADRVRGCLCDWGFYGASCSLRQCPLGDDPATPGVPEVQELRCSCGGSGYGCEPGGLWTVSFAGRTAKVRATAVASKADEGTDRPRGSGAAPGESLQSILESLRPGTRTFLSVQYSASDPLLHAAGSASAGACELAGSNAIRVTFVRALGNAPPLLVSPGTLVDTSGAPAQLTAFTVQQGTTESVPCSNQGTCSATDGTCSCFAGRYASDANGGPGSVPDCGSLSPPNGSAPIAALACPAPTCNGFGLCVTRASSSATVNFVADSANNQVRAVTSLGLVTSFAGSSFGLAGAQDGAASSATFTEPFGLALEADGSLLVAERAGCRLRRVSPLGRVTTLAGSGAPGGADGQGLAASFSGPEAVAVDWATGAIYVADTAMHAIRLVDPVTGNTTTLAGGAVEAFEATAGGPPVFVAGSRDGPAASAQFFAPAGLAVDQATGLVYIADTGNQLIRVLDAAEQIVYTLAGSRAYGAGSSDGVGTSASFFVPRGLAVARDFSRAGNRTAVFVADSGTLRKVDVASGLVTTIAGAAGSYGAQDGAQLAEVVDSAFGLESSVTALPTFSQNLGGVAIDPADGFALVADVGNNCVRRVSPHGVATTLAGGLSAAAVAAATAAAAAALAAGQLSPVSADALAAASSGDFGGLGTSARFSAPSGVAVAALSGTPVASCSCFAGFAGPTCLERPCPTGRAWFDEPSSATAAHAEAQCSGAGDCNRATGECTCLPGFAGAACDRMLCPSADLSVQCSGHGQCLSLRELASVGSFDGQPLGSLEVQLVTCSLTSGGFYARAQHSRTPRLPWNISVAALQQALQDLPFVGFLSVRTNPVGATLACSDGGGTLLSVTFLTALGDVDLLEFSPVSRSDPTEGVTAVEVVKGSRTTYGADPTSATTWDADMIFGCYCDGTPDWNHTDLLAGDLGSWYGPACTMRTCPVGSDALRALPSGAARPTLEVQTVMCNAAGGSFALSFRGQSSPQILATDGADEVRRKIESILSIGVVDVEMQPAGAVCSAAWDPAVGSRGSAPGTVTSITFRTELGDLPLLEVDSYYLTLRDPQTAQFAAGGSAVAAEAVKGVAALSDCAGRGLCDASSGLCGCFPAWFSSDGLNEGGRRGDCGVYSIAQANSFT